MAVAMCGDASKRVLIISKQTPNIVKELVFRADDRERSQASHSLPECAKIRAFPSVLELTTGLPTDLDAWRSLHLAVSRDYHALEGKWQRTTR